MSSLILRNRYLGSSAFIFLLPIASPMLTICARPRLLDGIDTAVILVLSAIELPEPLWCTPGPHQHDALLAPCTSTIRSFLSA